MKKTLIAIAALAATGAFAQSSVTISGTFDPSLAMVKTTYGNGNSVSQTLVANSRRGTSQLTFTGVEDLGGGLKANFRMENDFHAGLKADQAGANQAVSSAAATGVNLGSGGGDIFVGLSGDFGVFRIGSPNTPSLTTQASRDPYGTKTGSGFNTSKGTGRVRNAQTMYYETNSMSGFTFAAARAFGVNADANPATAIAQTGAVTDLGLNYANGPLRAGISQYSVGATSAQANGNSQINMYAQYDISPSLTGYIGAHTEKAAAAIGATPMETSGTNFAVKYMVSGPLSLMANLGTLKDKTSATNANNLKMMGLGLDYALSKRTTAYARMETLTYDYTVAASAVAKANATLFGLQHNF